MVEKVIQLKCSCNNYPWGKKGKESLAAVLCAQTPGTDFQIDESKDYAEMWMGTYPDLPSYILSTGEDLQEYMNKHAEELIGRTVIDKFGHTDLPFLPKVLSIAKALPLQLHPNKELAAKLHKEDPNQFTDPNHKPEIAVSLTDFEAFVGWLPNSQLASLFSLDPLKRYLPKSNSSDHTNIDDKTLKHIVHAMLTDKESSIAEVQSQLLKLPKDSFGDLTYIPSMIPRLQEQYDKTDPGILIALLTMNFLTLPPSSAIYIPADGVHAYLSGSIIECMARSNNVLNTGFCPAADRNSADLFVNTMIYDPHASQDCMLESEKWDRSGSGKSKVFRPPLSEFAVAWTVVEGKGGNEKVKSVGGPSVLIVTEGKGSMQAAGKKHELGKGYIFFVGQGVEVEFEASEGKLEVYRAFVE